MLSSLTQNKHSRSYTEISSNKWDKCSRVTINVADNTRTLTDGAKRVSLGNAFLK
ncbi:hypothetical protein DPMN_035102 [Dreissena polymorpha]|uniref:Uncharacterized protein n=1 Tax=Dreissena polymorpha TaxID=45954 RepID=A0A9D4MAA2_DREPO|nr:hypothetical protein DPMN_035102 [Dreissena polymorpha]